MLGSEHSPTPNSCYLQKQINNFLHWEVVFAALFIKALMRKGSLWLTASGRAERTDGRAKIQKAVGNRRSWRTSSRLLLMLRGELSRALAGSALPLHLGSDTLHCYCFRKVSASQKALYKMDLTGFRVTGSDERYLLKAPSSKWESLSHSLPSYSQILFCLLEFFRVETI